MRKPSIKKMRTLLVENEIEHIHELSSKNMFHYVADLTGFLDEKVYSDAQIENFFVDGFEKNYEDDMVLMTCSRVPPFFIKVPKNVPFEVVKNTKETVNEKG